MKKRKSNESTIKEAIDRFLKAYKLEDKVNEASLKERWDKIMGKPIAMRTEEIYIKNKVLIVKVNSAVMRSELQNARAKIVKMINDDAGKEIITNVLLA